MPDYMTRITQLVETGGEMGDVWNAGFKMMGFALGDLVCSILIGFFKNLPLFRLLISISALLVQFQQIYIYLIKAESGLYLKALCNLQRQVFKPIQNLANSRYCRSC